MEISSYCDNIAMELSSWKTRVQDVAAKLDSAPSGDKSGVLSQVHDLHILVSEMSDRISHFKTECPLETRGGMSETPDTFTVYKNSAGYLW